MLEKNYLKLYPEKSPLREVSSLNPPPLEAACNGNATHRLRKLHGMVNVQKLKHLHPPDIFILFTRLPHSYKNKLDLIFCKFISYSRIIKFDNSDKETSADKYITS